MRAANERYRIIYRLQDDAGVVSIEFIGIRREGSKADVYVLFSDIIERP